MGRGGNNDKQQQHSAAADSRSSASSASKKKVTWQELAKHTSRDDAWMCVRNKVYDITAWMSAHPGGADILHYNAGRDATQLFEAYHPLSFSALLTKHCTLVGELDEPELPVFPEPGAFYRDCKQRVEQHFKARGVRPTHSPSMLAWSAWYVATIIGVQCAVALGGVFASWTFLLPAAVYMGVVGALICLTTAHEASHCATTSSPTAWRVMGAAFDFTMGCSFQSWIHQHLLGHHPFTNIAEPRDIDPDVVTGDPDVRRIKAKQSARPHYHYQHLFVPLLYCLLGAKFRVNDLIMAYSTKMNGAIRMNEMTRTQHAIFVAGKLFWFAYRVALPFAVLPFSKALFISAVPDIISSYYLALVFQVNHIVPQARWPKVDARTKMVDQDWAEMQVATTLDYDHTSYAVAFLSGRLNYQVVHHLFPNVSQVWYPEVAPIVKQCAREHGIKYNYVDTFPQALAAHIAHLRNLGQMGTGGA